MSTKKIDNKKNTNTDEIAMRAFSIMSSFNQIIINVLNYMNEYYPSTKIVMGKLLFEDMIKKDPSSPIINFFEKIPPNTLMMSYESLEALLKSVFECESASEGKKKIEKKIPLDDKLSSHFFDDSIWIQMDNETKKFILKSLISLCFVTKKFGELSACI
jgi:hypothetical protein